jgi:hypothetical protein
MKNKKYHTVGKVPKYNTKIVEKGKLNTPNKQIHYHSLSWLGTGTSIKSGRVKLLLWVLASPLHEMMQLFSTCE